MKKNIIAILAFIFSFSVLSCNKEIKENNIKVENKIVSIPANEQDNYKETFEICYSLVHRVHNNDTDMNIYGRMFYPKDFDSSKKYSLVISSHGYNSRGMDGSTGLVEMFIKYNMVIYTFDFCGGGNMSKSDGKTYNMTLSREISDLKNVIQDLKKFEFVDTNNIVLFGHSMGGLVTSYVAKDLTNEIKGVILHAPAYTACESNRNNYKDLDSLDHKIKLNNMTISKDFIKDIQNYYPYKDLLSLDKKIFIMIGDKDNIVNDVDKMKELYGEKLTLQVVEGATHDFKYSDYDIVKDNIFNYLKNIEVL